MTSPERVPVPPVPPQLARRAWPPRTLAGRLDEHVVDSPALRGNPLGDPAERPLWVYVPPGYDDTDDTDDTHQALPAVYVLQGYTGALPMWRNRTAYRPTFVEAADELFARGDVPPALVVFVDAWTAYGGSQYVDSPGTGRYGTYVCDDVVGFVDARYRTLAAPAHRGVMGKSSGGFGAMILPMLRPDLFGALATHAGDALYELCYIPDFAKAARALRDEYASSYARFWADFAARPPMSKPTDGSLVLIYGCAAAFSADPDGTVALPFDVATGRLREDVWERWLAWDPVRMAERYAESLRGLRGIWIDAGKADDWYLDLGAEAFRAELERLGVVGGPGGVDLRFELFDATHMGIDYRYPMSLAYLAELLSPG